MNNELRKEKVYLDHPYSMNDQVHIDGGTLRKASYGVRYFVNERLLNPFS